MTSEAGSRPPQTRRSGAADGSSKSQSKTASNPAEASFATAASGPGTDRANAARDNRTGTAQAAGNGHATGSGHATVNEHATADHLRDARRGLSAATAPLIRDDPLAALLDEAQAAVSEGANALRDVRERYRSAYLERVERWERLRAIAGGKPDASSHSNATRNQAATDELVVGREVGQERSTLGRIDLAVRSLENAWLFLAREDSSLVTDPQGPPSAADAQMRIVEAQEAERTRLAREVHDGPAQALSNAIFQVEVVQRLLDRDERLARQELRQLGEVLTRELRGVRAYLSQLRPPLLADLGLSGAIREAADQIASALDIPVHVELDPEIDGLPETIEIVTLRVIQEALQNVRKHAKPRTVRVTMARDEHGWTLEVRDDGKGFEAVDPLAGGRRHFGLQFMRERAELIGARFEVRSSPDLGTAVHMTIPPGAMGMPIPAEEH